MIEQFKNILKKHGVENKEVSERFGLSHQSYLNVTGPRSRVVPKWVKSFLFGYWLRSQKIKK